MPVFYSCSACLGQNVSSFHPNNFNLILHPKFHLPQIRLLFSCSKESRDSKNVKKCWEKMWQFAVLVLKLLCILDYVMLNYNLKNYKFWKTLLMEEGNDRKYCTQGCLETKDTTEGNRLRHNSGSHFLKKN